MAPAARPVDVDLPLVYETRYRFLVGLARTLVDSHAEAEEVVQDVFVRLYARVRTLSDVDDIERYLHRAVLNRARSRLRRRRTARDRRHLLAERGVDATPTLHDRDAEAVRAAVRELPRRQMECVVLRYYASRTDAEIAALLGIGAGSVKQHLSRARAALSARLEDLS